MRVIVADDQIEVRSAIRLLLEEKAGLEVVGEARDSETLIKLVKTARPDLVILDWELAGAKAGEAMTALRGLKRELAVIVLSSRPQVQEAAFKAGARAFVCKSDPPESLVKAINKWQDDRYE
jgi:DNA-binding NarL/FixJ family response regulator